MSAIVSTLWYVDAPDPAAVLRESEPDRVAARAILERLFPDRRVVPGERTTLTGLGRTATGDPIDGTETEEVFVGSYPGVTVLSSPRLALRNPSQLPTRWLHTLASRRTYLLASHPPGAWGSFAAWEHGSLLRSFGANTLEFFEDEGLPFPWERPFWSGLHPIRWPAGIPVPPQPLPFHPRKLVEEAHAAWLGLRYVGRRDDELDPGTIDVWSYTLAPASAPVPERIPPPRPWWQRVLMR